MEIAKLTAVMPVDTPPLGEARPAPQRVEPAVEQAEAQKARSEAQRELQIRHYHQKELQESIQKLQQAFDVKVELETNEETGRSVARIMSADGRIIRQMPPEGVIALAEQAHRGRREGLLDSLV